MVSKQKKKVPEWMSEWLQIRVFEDGMHCKKHGSQYETYFCCECMGKPLCPCCWKNSKEHIGHESIQVHTCSCRTGVNVLVIKQFWDVSDIQDYIVNGKQIVYLNTDKDPNTQNQVNGSGCQICSKKLIRPEFKFCSIACKKQMIESEPKPSLSLRPEHRKRKGVPSRAPLF